jgi:flagellar FliJ protein
MPARPSINTLLDFAQKESDISAKKLGQLASQQQEAIEKLHLLLEYRRNYQSRFQDAAKNGIDHIEWLNFITFMDKLDAAITEQRKSVTTAQANREAGGKEFQTCQRKLKSYNTLSKRYLESEMQQKMKYEQKEQDEFASHIDFHQDPKQLNNT